MTEERCIKIKPEHVKTLEQQVMKEDVNKSMLSWCSKGEGKKLCKEDSIDNINYQCPPR